MLHMQIPEGKKDHDLAEEQDLPACLETGRGKGSEMRVEGQLGPTRGHTEWGQVGEGICEPSSGGSVATQQVFVSWRVRRWAGREDGGLLDPRLPPEGPCQGRAPGKP